MSRIPPYHPTRKLKAHMRDAEKGRKQREFKKGLKKDFVNDNITTKLVDEFKLDLVYNLDSVRK
ncbi:hypothetical protein C8J57DRAFT_1458901, partial [Mycena rebaudengoi]